MCYVIKGLAVPLFMINIYSGGMKTAAFGQKNGQTLDESGGFWAKHGQNLDFLPG